MTAGFGWLTAWGPPSLLVTRSWKASRKGGVCRREGKRFHFLLTKGRGREATDRPLKDLIPE